MEDLDPDDILVLVCHPQLEVWMRLREWLPKRPGAPKKIRPIAAKHARTGEPLPLTAIPLAVRNDPECWEAVRLGWMQDPEWPNEHYGARVEAVNVEEGILCVTTKGEQRTVLLVADTEMVLLKDSEFRPLKGHWKDENLKPGAEVILMTKRKGDKEIAFQVQVITKASDSLQSAPVAEKV